MSAFDPFAIARTAVGPGCMSVPSRAFGLLPVGHTIHFHRFKFGKIEPEVLCDERA